MSSPTASIVVVPVVVVPDEPSFVVLPQVLTASETSSTSTRARLAFWIASPIESDLSEQRCCALGRGR